VAIRDVKSEDQIKNLITQEQKKNVVLANGMILAYHSKTNTADIITAKPGSGQMGHLYKDVPCPVVSPGVQTVSPIPGRPCSVTFRDGNEAEPIISHFYNQVYADIDHEKQYYAEDEIPRFMSEL